MRTRILLAIVGLLNAASQAGAQSNAQPIVNQNRPFVDQAAIATGAPGQTPVPVSQQNPLPVAGRQEVLKIISANVPAATASFYGGTYLFNQVCSAYGTVQLQVLGPDGSTYQTLVSKTGADTAGTTVVLGSGAVAKATVSGTTGCNALLSRIP